MYVIDINTHVLIFCLYYFVVPGVQFWTTGRLKVLTKFQCILHHVIILSSKEQNLSKFKYMIIEILVLLIDFSYFDAELL